MFSSNRETMINYNNFQLFASCLNKRIPDMAWIKITFCSRIVKFRFFFGSAHTVEWNYENFVTSNFSIF